jgi:hypothetical protein
MRRRHMQSAGKGRRHGSHRWQVSTLIAIDPGRQRIANGNCSHGWATRSRPDSTP